MTPWVYLRLAWDVWRARRRHEYRLNIEQEIKSLKERDR